MGESPGHSGINEVCEVRKMSAERRLKDVAQGTIRTGRISLAPLKVADADDLANVLSDPLLYQFTGGSPPSADELRATYRRQITGRADALEVWRNWIIRAEPDGQPVGYVQATISADWRTAELAWVIGTGFQRRGYATAAARAVADWLRARGVGRLQAHIRPGHEASARVAARVGLRPTGTMQDGEQLWLSEDELLRRPARR
jgi:RimJ/RimL family protein N-acetyltransferase